MAVIFPRSRKGGEALAFIVRKPATVVALVRKIGHRLRRKLSAMAADFSSPRAIAWRTPDTRWTLSAMASVRMIDGAAAEPGLRTNPAQPEIPMAVRVAATTTASVPMTPPHERSIKTRSSNTNVAIPYLVTRCTC